MLRRTYVSDIYQWVIDDVVSKIKPEFIRRGVNESVLIELAEKWEHRILQMKICEVPDVNLKLPNIPSNIYIQNKIVSVHENRTIPNINFTQINPECQLQQYQNAVGLLSRQFVKIPIHRPNDHDYFFFLCQQYLVAIKNLQTQIKALETPPDKTHSSFAFRTLLTPKHCTESVNGIKKFEYDVNYQLKGNLSNNIAEVVKNEAMTSKPKATKDLDCEELSDLSTSDSEVSHVSNKCKTKRSNRIDCFYSQIKRKKMGQHNRWLNKVKLGTMFTNGREYLFKDAILDIAWDITKTN
jgi:hypothetical protein